MNARPARNASIAKRPLAVALSLLLVLLLAACDGSQRRELEDENTGLREETVRLEEETARLETRLGEVETERDELRERVTELESEVERFRTRAAELEQELERTLEAQLNRVENELEATRSEVETLEGRRAGLRDQLGVPVTAEADQPGEVAGGGGGLDTSLTRLQRSLQRSLEELREFVRPSADATGN